MKSKILLAICALMAILLISNYNPAQEGDGTPITSGPSGKIEGMILVPAGEFIMGCNAAMDQCYDKEKPVHKVYLDAFYIDKYDVTVQQYGACVQSGKCTKPHTGQSCNWGVSGQVTL